MALKASADEFLREIMQTEVSLEKIARHLELEFTQRFSETGVGSLNKYLTHAKLLRGGHHMLAWTCMNLQAS